MVIPPGVTNHVCQFFSMFPSLSMSYFCVSNQSFTAGSLHVTSFAKNILTVPIHIVDNSYLVNFSFSEKFATI